MSDFESRVAAQWSSMQEVASLCDDRVSNAAGQVKVRGTMHRSVAYSAVTVPWSGAVHSVLAIAVPFAPFHCIGMSLTFGPQKTPDVCCAVPAFGLAGCGPTHGCHGGRPNHAIVSNRNAAIPQWTPAAL